jgi:FkbM family methyltransferase
MYDVIKPGDVVYDVGTEEGDLSALYAQWVGDRGGVCLFEPNPRVWPNSRIIWSANGLRKPLGYWVGFASDVTEDFPPNLDFDLGDQDGWPSCAYGEVIRDHGFRQLAESTDNTPQITLDDFAFRTNTIPDVITIDVEGSELRVLKGATKLLSAIHPVIFCSVHPMFMDAMYQQTEEELWEFMDSMRYEKTWLAQDHETHWMLTP